MPLFGPPDIGQLEVQGDVSGLAKALNHRDHEVGLRAAAALGRIGDRATPDLLDRAVATIAVGVLPVEVSGTFKRYVGADRAAALRDLERFGARAVVALLAILDDHWADDLRTETVAVLGRIGDERAIEPIVMALDTTPGRIDVDVAAGALRGLGVTTRDILGWLEGSGDHARQAAHLKEPFLGEAAEAELFSALDDPNLGIRAQAAWALRWLETVDGHEPLIRALADPEPRVRESAAAALGRHGVVEAVDPVARLIEDSDAPVRKAAAEALGDLEAVGIGDRLVQLLDDPVGDVRQATLLALARVGDERQVDAVTRRLGDESPYVRSSAAKALARLAGAAAADPIAAALAGEEDEWATKQLMAALGQVDAARLPEPRRGGLDEPYCSDSCYDRGGTAITYWLGRGWTGACSVCGREVEIALGRSGGGSLVYYRPGADWDAADRLGLVRAEPRDNPDALLHFHQTDECAGRVRSELSRSTACVVCGTATRPPPSPEATP